MAFGVDWNMDEGWRRLVVMVADTMALMRKTGGESDAAQPRHIGRLGNGMKRTGWLARKNAWDETLHRGA